MDDVGPDPGRRTLVEQAYASGAGAAGVVQRALAPGGVARWTSSIAPVGAEAARALGLVPFAAVQMRRDELERDLDQLDAQSDGDIADDLVHDADHLEDARALYQQAQAAFRAGDLIRAGELFERAAVANRSERRSALYNAALAYGRALTARGQGARRRGRGGAGQARPSGQLSDADLAALGESPGESAGAIADQESAREDFQQGMRDYRAGEDEAAAEGFERSAARAPQAAGDLNYNAGMAHFRAGDYEAAVRTFRAALGLAAPTAGREGGGAAPGAAVQRQAEHGAGDEAGYVHALAEHGIRSTGAALPHLDAIQRSFGHHDVSGIVAHVGGETATAARGIGARAYAAGNHVAFADTPDLHLAAHEAAHVVQQRGGVSLKGGVGEVGDTYEQHADEVADRVVRGESAQALLDRFSAAPSPGAAPSSHVQLRGNRPLRERTIQFRIRTPSTYEALEQAIEEELSRDLMSRTEVEQPDGSRGPIRRERALVEASNLREVYGNLQPGGSVVLTARLIPGAHRYERLVFSIPNRDGGTLPETTIRGGTGGGGGGGESPRQVPEGVNLPSTRLPEEIRDATIGQGVGGALTSNAATAVLETVAFIDLVVLGTLASVLSAVVTAVVIAGELADLADNNGQTTEGARGFGVAYQAHRIAEYAFAHGTGQTNAVRDAYLRWLRESGNAAYGRLREKILDALPDLNTQFRRAAASLDAGRGQQSGRRFTSQRELADHLIATAGVRASTAVYASSYNAAYYGSRSYIAGTPRIR